MKFVCPKCKKEVEVNNLSNKANHIRWCDRPSLDDYNWKLFQDEYDNLHSWAKVARKLHKSNKIIRYGIDNGLLISHKLKHTEETKKHLSEKRKEYLKNNPESHCWKSNNKFKSEPCEYFKNILRRKNISFIEEYQPLENRFFSIDVVFLNNKIGIEINGNQHYNKDGTLKKYYQERHNLIEKEGWKLYEIPYLKVYDNKFIEDFIENIKFNIDTNIVYTPLIKQKKKYFCVDCGKEISYKSKRCIKCHLEKNIHKKYGDNFIFPTKEQLLSDIQTMSMLKVGKKYNVSDNTIRKWCRKYGILNKRKNKKQIK